MTIPSFNNEAKISYSILKSSHEVICAICTIEIVTKLADEGVNKAEKETRLSGRVM
jgi:hypothetical protein